MTIKNQNDERALTQGLRHAKWAFSTRRVSRDSVAGLRAEVAAAVSGDLVLGRVERPGSHRRLQLAEGRYSELYEGDLVVVACGARYASDQFEGLARLGEGAADLLAGGGCIGTMRFRHARMKAPTTLVPLGLLTNQAGEVVNLADFALPPSTGSRPPSVIGIVGASMNSGKTSAAAALVHGLQAAGFRTAALKATGTSAFGDWWAYHDAGARFVADFTDAGMVSTYLQPPGRLRDAVFALVDAAGTAGCDFAVVEFADGVLQTETHALLADAAVARLFDGFLFAAADGLAAAGGAGAVSGLGHVVLGLTGLMTASPLITGEAARATGLPVYSRESLCDPAVAASVVQGRSRAKPGLRVAA